METALLPLKQAVDDINRNVEVLGKATQELRTQTDLWRKQCAYLVIIIGDLNGELTPEGSPEQ